MGEEVTPRCWAKSLTFGAYCAHDAGHKGIHESKTKRFLWDDEIASADEHGVTGRKTAALRILEVSHELDRLAFLDGDSDEFVDTLRVIAARLYANASAAKQDHRDLVSFIKGTRQHLQESKADDAIRREVTAIVELVELAADILRPFVS